MPLLRAGKATASGTGDRYGWGRWRSGFKHEEVAIRLEPLGIWAGLLISSVRRTARELLNYVLRKDTR